MKVYVFGNSDINIDSKPLTLVRNLKKDFPTINFVEVKPNQEVTFDSEDIVYIIDSVQGLSKAVLLDESSIDSISPMSSASVHGYDLGFQLKYLKKLGKIKKVSILGVPMTKRVSYKTFQSSFRKLVAQDMQGS